MSKTFETRRAAFREAKRDGGIPCTKHPSKVCKPDTPDGKDLDQRNRRLYIFEFFIQLFGSSGKRQYFIREDKKVIYSDGDEQMDHFNAGKKRKRLKKHYYFKRR